MTILEAMSDPQLFGPWFTGETWHAWRTFLAALFALLMSEQEFALYRRCTGRTVPPSAQAREAWVAVGRRGGKSRIAALVAVFIAVFVNHRKYLAPGERAVVMVLAADRRQARIIFNYARAFLRVPLLAKMVTGETREEITLSNGAALEIHTSSFKSVRGYSCAAVICDEIAFWDSGDAANPDKEVLASLRPALATLPGSMLLCISSPYSRSGELWRAYRQHFGAGEDDPVVYWQSDSQSMNPTLDPQLIADAYREDAAAAAAEWGGLFRHDVESFLSQEAIEHCVVPGRRELPPVSRILYTAFLDPAGGSGSDSFGLAIAHRDEAGHAVLDCVRERRPPFSPASVVEEFTATLKAYGLHTVSADKWGGEFVREPFQTAGVRYQLADKTRSDLYLHLLPMVNSSAVELLDNPRLVAQLCGLERRTGRSGRDTVDHRPGGHDDLANCVAGALVGAMASTHVVVAPVSIGVGASKWTRTQGEGPRMSPFRICH